MERTITIDGQEVRLRASAAIPRLYRIKFHRDILQDMQKIRKELELVRNEKKEATECDTAMMEVMNLVENVAYIMAKHADKDAVPDTVEDWMNTMEPFSIMKILPVVIDLWTANMQTTVQPVKKLKRRSVK